MDLAGKLHGKKMGQAEAQQIRYPLQPREAGSAEERRGHEVGHKCCGQPGVGLGYYGRKSEEEGRSECRAKRKSWAGQGLQAKAWARVSARKRGSSPRGTSEVPWRITADRSYRIHQTISRGWRFRRLKLQGLRFQRAEIGRSGP